MTNTELEQIPDGIYFLPSGIQLEKNPRIITLKNPSNTAEKSHITLVTDLKEIYQVNNYKFGKGRKFESTKDDINDRYHYDEQGKPLRSAIMVSDDDKTNYNVLPSSTIKLLTKYDLAYSLIGYKFRESTAASEKEYVKEAINTTTIKDDGKYLTLRDYADHLVDTCDKNWEYIPMDILTISLSKISETIEEAGDTYYKVTIESVLDFLSKKVIKLVQNFPKSITIPNDLDDKMKINFKVFMSVNIFISLIPKCVYQKLRSCETKLEDLDTTISKAFKEYETHFKASFTSKSEEAFLLQSATNVGLERGDGPVKDAKKSKSKPVVKKPKVAVGRGAIDGFFKKK